MSGARPALLAVVALAGSLLCDGVRAQSRLGELLERAVTRHPAVLQAQSQSQAAGYELDAARWGRYPALTTELRSDASAAQSVARLEQPLWTGGRITSRIELGEANLRTAQATVREAQANALAQVSAAYFDVLRLSARLATARDNIAEHQRLVDLITRRVQSQVSPPADATLAQARLQQAVTEQLQIQRQLDATRNTLSQWVGAIDARLAEPARIDYRRASSDAVAVERALQASGPRQKLQAQIDGAQAQIALARAQALPTVVAGYQHIVGGPLPAGGDRGRTYVGLQFQPGAGLGALAGIQAAASRQEAVRQELQALERSLESQVRTVYAEIDVLQAQVAPAQALQEGTAGLVDSYLRQYQVGRKNWLDVLNALREKTQALYSLADVRYALLQSQVKLLVLTGDIDAQDRSAIHD